MHQLGALRRGARRKVVSLHQRDAQPSSGRVESNARACGPATNHQDVKRPGGAAAGQSGQLLLPGWCAVGQICKGARKGKRHERHGGRQAEGLRVRHTSDISHTMSEIESDRLGSEFKPTSSGNACPLATGPQFCGGCTEAQVLNCQSKRTCYAVGKLSKHARESKRHVWDVEGSIAGAGRVTRNSMNSVYNV